MSGANLTSITVSGIAIKGPGAKFAIIANDEFPMFFVDSFKFCTFVRGEFKFDSLIHSKVVPSRIELSDNLIISSLPDGEKKLTFNIDAITDGFTRTIFMPDFDVFLGNMADFILLNEGDLLTRDATQLIALPIGPTDYVLKSNGVGSEWSNIVLRLNQGQSDVTIVGTYTVQTTDGNTVSLVTSAGNNIAILPDATTLPSGWQVTIINHSASTELLIVQTNGGGITRSYTIGQSVTVRLLDNSTVSGLWSFTIPGTGYMNVITVAKAGGDFTTISDAMGAVTNSSISNNWLIRVAPGIYIEDAIICETDVNIEGMGTRAATVVASNPSNIMFTANTNGCISNLTLTGAVNGTCILVNAVDNYAIENNTFVNMNIAIDISHTPGLPGITRVRLDGNFYQNISSYGMRIFGPTTGPENINVVSRSSAWSDNNSASHIAISLSGPRILCSLTDETLAGATPPTRAGTSIYIEDGCELICSTLLIRNYSTAIQIANVGTPPQLYASNLIINNCNADIQIDHPGSFGDINGVFDQNLTTINPSANFSILLQDPNLPNNGTKITGDLYLGNEFADITNVSPQIQDSSMLGKLTGGAITIGVGLSVDVTSGSGYIKSSTTNLQFIEWAGINIILPANSVSYIYVDENGIILNALSRPDQQETILLGRIGTLVASNEFIDRSNLDSNHLDLLDDLYIRDIFGGLYASGSLTTNNVTDNLQVTSGRFYFVNNQFNPSGLNFGTSWFIYHHLGGVMGRQGTQVVVDDANFDNGTNLVAVGAGNFMKHSFYIVGDGVDEEYMLVYSQATYASLVLAQDGTLPTPPNYFNEGILPIAAIVTEEAVGVVDIIDIRPRPANQAPATSGVTAHGSLSGLLNDDHPQYLLVSGTRAMTGNLMMGANNITTTGLVDGVTVSAHATRHTPSGADPLPVGVPVTLNATPGNIEGTLNSFARQDHKHELDISAIEAAIDHNTLLNLTVGDVHTQYLPVDGTRAMTGDLDLGNNDINNGNTINSINNSTGTLTLLENAGVGPDTIGITAPVLAASYTLVLPVDDGALGDVLTTDGTGVLSWATSTVADHNALLNLTVGDAHTQYFRTDGTRMMAGDILVNQNNITNALSISLFDSTFTITLQPPVLGASYTLTLPVDDGNAGEFLITDGTGILSWFDLSGAGDPFPQYFRIDGTSVMTGDIQVGGFDILTTGGDLNFGAGGGDIVNVVNLEIKSGVTAFSVLVNAPAGLTADWTMVLPLTNGAINQFLQTDGTGVTDWVTPDHSLLLNLLADDHPQYLLVSGARAMTGDLDMGANNITNVNLVDGVNIPAHAARHLPAGADPLTTAAPVTDLDSTTTNSVGTANSLARSDHTHALDLTSINAAMDHGLLLGLADDDHLQYFRTDGTRVMAGNINMDPTNTFDIDNLGVANFHDAGTGRTVSIFAPAGLTTTWALTLPNDNGNANQFMQTDSFGVTSWATPDHSLLLNLLADDHPQYLLVDGTRAMAGDLDMDGNDLVDALSLELRETGGGTDVITLSAPAVLAASYDLVLPVDDGNSGEFLQTDGAGNLSWAVGGGATILPPYLEMRSDDFRNPTTADWAVNALAPSIPDPINSGLHVRAFDDTAEEGVGFSVRIPASATALTLQIELRKQTAAAGTIIFNLYTRRINNAGLVSAWSILGNSQLLPIIAGIADANWQYVTMASKLFTTYAAATRPTIGETSQFQLTRSTADTTTDDVFVERVIVNFT